MEYEYIRRTYGASFYPGDKVFHTATKKSGEVISPKQSHLHYVRVHFGACGVGLCHPQELKIIARGEKWGDAQREVGEAQSDGKLGL